MADGQMNIRATLDLSDLERKAARYGQAVRQMGVVTNEQGQVMSTAWTRMKQAAGAYLTLDIVKRIAQTRGEFQSLNVAFTTMLGDGAKAQRLMSESVELAAHTPFTLQDVASGAKQLLAYGFAAEEITDTLRRLGDVASALGLPMERLTYLYGTTATQGRLYARDMIQFTTSGVPVLQELAKMYGKTTEEINSMVTAGKIGFDDVKKVFEQMTNEGGRFYNLMEETSKTITGKISNLGDAIEEMFNGIGQANEGIINGAIDGAKYLVENYEKVLSILKVLVATYGTYKASLIAVAAAQRVSVTIQNISAWLSLAKTIRTAKDAQIAFNLATKANPYVLLATVLIGVGTALYQFTKNTTRASKASAKLAADIKTETGELDKLFSRLKNAKSGTDERKKSIEEINSKYGNYLSNLLNEKSNVEEVAAAYDKVKKSIIEANLERSRTEYLQKPSEGIAKSTQEFYEAANSFIDKLDTEDQKGKFKAYIDQIVDSLKEGGSFDIDQVYSAFRAAQSKEAYTSVDDWLKAFRTGIEKYGLSDREIIDKVGGWDISNLSGAGKDIEIYSKSLANATKEFEEFSKAYRKAITPPETTSETPIRTFSEQLKEAKKNVEVLEKQLSDLRSGKTTSKDYNKDISDTLSQLSDARKVVENLTGITQKANEKRVNDLEKINEELLSLQKQNQQAQIDLMQEGTEKELAQIRLDYQEKIAEIKKLADKWASEQGGTLTAEQTVQISTAYSNAKQEKEQDESDVYKKQTDELNELLKQYQSYQQQRLEIETKYNKDIERLQEQLAKTTEESERNRLEESIRVAEEKKKTELSGLDLEEFQKKIDWSSVFGNLDKLSTDALKRLREKIKEYLSKVGEGISKEDLKTVVDAFENLDAAIANRTPLEELVSGYKDYRKAVEEVIKAKEELDKADNPEAKERAIKNLSDAEKKRAESLSKMTQSVNAIGQQGQQVVSAGNDLVTMLTNLGIKVPESISGTLSGLGQVMDGLAEIDLTKPMSIVTGVIHSLAGVTKMVGSIFGLGSDNGLARYQALKEQLEAINQVYDKIIDKSKEKIVFGGGFASIEASEEAMKSLNKQMDNYRRLAEAGGNAGASSGSHSYAHRANKRISGQFDEMSKAIGKNISRVQDMYDLTGDELYVIQTQFPAAWKKIPPEITDNLEKIIECKEEAEELRDALNEAMTGISYDSFYNGFIDSLADMDTSFEDMCDDFESYLRKSIIAGLVASQYKGRIEKLYESWVGAAKSDEKITEYEAESLRNEYQNIIQDMIKDRENMAKTFGWEASPGQVKSQSGAISETIKESTASEMTGIWRGQYDTLKGIYTVNSSFYESYKSTMSICNGILNQIADNTGRTAENTTVLSGINDMLSRMDGRLKTLESNSNKKYI